MKCHRRILWSILLTLMAARLPAQEAWRVPSAPLRVDLNIAVQPVEPEAGLLVRLPDGGLLPGRHPVIEAFSTRGQPLETLVLWHNPDEFLLAAVEPPPQGDRLQLYVRGSAMVPSRSRDTNLKPGLLLYTREGNASLSLAQRLPDTWPPSGPGRMGPVPLVAHRENPFGADDDFISWYSGWFKLEEDEKIYFATVSDEGSEIHIDRQAVASWPGIHTRAKGAQGQFGGEADLQAGWHRLDYFHFEATGPQEMTAAWRRAGKKGLPEQIPATAFAQSGEARIAAMVYRDGRRAGWIQGAQQAAGYLWIGDRPVHKHLLRAESGELPSPPGFFWRTSSGHGAQGREFAWLIGAGDDVTITLISSNRSGLVRQQLPLVSGTTPPRSSLNNARDRADYLRVYAHMIRSTPAGRDPCAHWNRDLWRTLFELIEPYRAGELLRPLFESQSPSLARLPDAERWMLEDRLIESLRLLDDTRPLLQWIDRLEQRENSRPRRFHWRAERVMALLYDLGDTNAARRVARTLREAAATPDERLLATIRQADVDRVAGDFESAARRYEEAQKRYRERSRGLSGSLPSDAFQSSDGPASGQATTRGPRPLPSLGERDRVEAWKSFTLQSVTFLITVQTLIEQDALAEAFETLRRWEMEEPLSKLTGDFPLAEARLYSHVGDHRRALRTLRAGRQGNELSSNLPDLMSLELESLLRLRRHDEARELAREIMDRLEGHPLATRARELLE